MASSAEPTVRTPFTLVETSTLDNTWNTSVTLSASTNYKEYKTVEVRTATAKKNCMNKTVNCTASWGAPPSERKKGLSPVKCSQTSVDGLRGSLLTEESSLYGVVR